MKTREPFKRMIYSDIRKGYEMLGGNPFGIEPNKPLKPLIPCSAHTECKNTYDPNTGHWDGTCKGWCSGC